MARKTTHCARCGTLKIRREGYSRCLPCARRHGRDFYDRNEAYRSRNREHYLRRRYGTTLEELTVLLVRQGGACAICRRAWRECVAAKKTRHEAIFLNHLCVDHDHATGTVRGLLCNACNTAIGLLEELPPRFNAAIAYLKSF